MLMQGHKLPDRARQPRADHHREHHLYDGAGLDLPGRVRQPPHHGPHQAGRVVAACQPRLPRPRHHSQHSSAGKMGPNT